MTLKTDDNIVDKYLLNIQKGDDSYFSQLYDCTYKQLYTLCYSIFKNRFQSEDALHDSYLKIIQAIGKYNGRKGFNWMFTITKNTCLNIIKKNKRINLVDFSEKNAENALNTDNSAGIKIEDESGIIAVAEKVLNQTELKIVLLHAVGGIKFKQIALIMNKIEATVRWKYNNALKKVLKEYEKNN